MRKKEYNSQRDFVYSYDGRSLTIQGVRDTSVVELNIPPIIDGKKVSVVGNSAFTFCKNLRKIIIPDTVTTVENSAFKGLMSLEEAVLSSELVSIGSMAFAGCRNLKRLTISNHADRFDISTFRDCTSLEKVFVKIKETFLLGDDGIPDEAAGPKIREFAAGCSMDETRLACIKSIISATDPRSNYMSKYDSVFLEILDEDDKYRIATYRLRNPYELDEQYEIVYRNTLTGMISSIILEDKVERLTAIGELGCIDNESLSEYIDAASRIGGGCIAYLLEYKNRTTGIRINDFEL